MQAGQKCVARTMGWGGDAMGFSYRKSVKMGPFRVTASKSGISSAGVNGPRVTKRANGKVQTLLSAPTRTLIGPRRWSQQGHSITIMRIDLNGGRWLRLGRP
jgi:hypothetical protein